MVGIIYKYTSPIGKVYIGQKTEETAFGEIKTNDLNSYMLIK